MWAVKLIIWLSILSCGFGIARGLDGKVKTVTYNDKDVAIGLLLFGLCVYALSVLK